MAQKQKAVVLFSGGVDSTTCLALAIERFGKENVVPLSIQYGQKHSKELEAAANQLAPMCPLETGYSYLQQHP